MLRPGTPLSPILPTVFASSCGSSCRERGEGEGEGEEEREGGRGRERGRGGGETDLLGPPDLPEVAVIEAHPRLIGARGRGS